MTFVPLLTLIFKWCLATHNVHAKKAATIRAVYFKAIHITCIIERGLHWSAGNVRRHFPGVDKSVARAIFLKALSRVLLLNLETPGVLLSSEPVPTSLGIETEANGVLEWVHEYFQREGLL